MSNRPQDGAPSFNRPELVRYDSLRDSKDLGPLRDIKARLSGFIGGEAGSQSLFFSFTLTEPGTIQVQAVTDSRWTQRFVSVGLRSDTGAIGLDERGNARGVDVVNTCGVDEALTPFPPGRYTVVVGCSQWQTTPFGVILRVNPTTRLYGNLVGRGGLARNSKLRIGTVRLEGSLIGRGSLGSPGVGLFSGRRDRPLRQGPLTGRGGLTGTLSIREPLRTLAAAFLSGNGGLGRSTLISNQLGPTMWVSRLTTLTEMSTGASPAVTLVDGDYSYQVFYFRPAGSVASQQRLAIVYRDPQGIELWMRITDIFVEAQDTGGWRLVPLLGGDALIYNTSGVTFNLLYGLYVMRIRSNGTVAWKRQVTVATPGATGGTFVNSITHIRDVTSHFGLGLMIFSITIGSHMPAYLYLDPVDGSYEGCRALVGQQLTAGGFFGTQHESNGPLIKADGRLILSGARSVAPVYTWIVECDALCTSLSQFWKYADGTNLNFATGSCLHPDGSITLYGGFANDSKLRLNPDFTIRGRTLTQGSSFGGAGGSGRQFVTDSDGTIYSGGGFSPSILSMEQEAAVAYRGLSVTGMPGRTDQTSTRKPSKWFNLATRYAIASPDAASAASGLGCLMFGFDIDMAPTVVSGTGYTMTVGSSDNVSNTIPLPPSGLIIQRYPDELGGGITTPILFANAALVLNTDSPSWNPTFVDASTLFAFERRTSSIRRSTNVTIPKLRVKENPAVEPDPYSPFVTFHLPGSGPADTCAFVDRGPFSLLPAQIQGGPRHSIEQSRFPDLGGFFEPTSIRFDGTGDAIVYGSSPAFRIGRGDFSLEAWIYRLNGSFTLFDNALLGDPSSHTNSFALFIDSVGRPRLQVNNIGRDAALFNGGASYRLSVPLATWTHVAVSREDTIWRVHVNGVLDGSGLLLDTDLTAAGLLIGRACQGIGTSYQLVAGFGNFGGEFINPVGFSGFLADIRFTLGAARYHRSFQPRNAPIQYVPTGPPLSLPAGTEPAESGTPLVDLDFNETLLFARLNGSGNSFFDDGPYAHSLVAYGNAQQLSGGKWSNNHGVFDTFGDYIDVVASPALALGAGDFTIALWGTRVGEGQGPETFQYLIDSRTAEPSVQIALRVNRAATGRQLSLYVDGAIRILGEPMVLGTRYHVALVRRNGVVTLYMNGVPVGAPWIDVTNYTATVWTIARGRFPDGGGDMSQFNGNLNDVRILRKALYTGSFTPPIAPLAGPPTATARYWRLFDLRHINNSSQYAISELALQEGRGRVLATVASSSPAPNSGLLTNTQDLSLTISCTWFGPTLEQIDSWIQLDAGTPVVADAIQLAGTAVTSQGLTGFSLGYSDDGINFTTLGHITGVAMVNNAFTPRLGLMPLALDPGDADSDKVVLYLRGETAGAEVVDSSPRALTVTSSNVSKSNGQVFAGSQSLLFSAASNSYLTLGGPSNRSVFFSFGTRALTVEMAVFPLTLPPTEAALFCTNGIGDSGTYATGFMLVLTNALKLNLYINGSFRGASVGTVPLGAWTSIKLTRSGTGLWRYTINGVTDATTIGAGVTLSNRSFTIGRDGANGADLRLFNGYMDEIRVTRGVSRGFASGVSTHDLQGVSVGAGALSGSTLVIA